MPVRKLALFLLIGLSAVVLVGFSGPIYLVPVGFTWYEAYVSAPETYETRFVVDTDGDGVPDVPAQPGVDDLKYRSLFVPQTPIDACKGQPTGVTDEGVPFFVPPPDGYHSFTKDLPAESAVASFNAHATVYSIVNANMDREEQGVFLRVVDNSLQAAGVQNVCPFVELDPANVRAEINSWIDMGVDPNYPGPGGDRVAFEAAWKDFILAGAAYSMADIFWAATDINVAPPGETSGCTQGSANAVWIVLRHDCLEGTLTLEPDGFNYCYIGDPANKIPENTIGFYPSADEDYNNSDKSEQVHIFLPVLREQIRSGSYGAATGGEERLLQYATAIAASAVHEVGHSVGLVPDSWGANPCAHNLQSSSLMPYTPTIVGWFRSPGSSLMGETGPNEHALVGEAASIADGSPLGWRIPPQFNLINRAYLEVVQ